MLFHGLFIASIPKYFHVNSSSYIAWLGTADHLLDLRPPPPPLFLLTLPSVGRVWKWWFALLALSIVYLAVWTRDGQALPRRVKLSFGIVNICSDKQLKGQFCLGHGIYSLNKVFTDHHHFNPFSSSLSSTLQRQFRLYIPFLGIARPQPQFPHSCVCWRFIYSQDRSTYFLQQKRQTHRGNILYNSLTDTWMWKLGLRPRYSFSGNICFNRHFFFAVNIEELNHLFQPHEWK